MWTLGQGPFCERMLASRDFGRNLAKLGDLKAIISLFIKVAFEVLEEGLFCRESATVLMKQNHRFDGLAVLEALARSLRKFNESIVRNCAFIEDGMFLQNGYFCKTSNILCTVSRGIACGDALARFTHALRDSSSNLEFSGGFRQLYILYICIV